MAKLLAAKESFVGDANGTEMDVKGGDLIDDQHPLVKKYPAMFQEPHVRFPVPEKPAPKAGK